MWTQWQRLERPGLRRIQESVIPLWESTREFRIYSPFLIPGPVQTAAYIRALLKAVRDRRPNLVDDIEQAVEVRVATQHVTREGDHQFTIVLEENVLRHQIGGPAVLREQLEYLRSAMSLPSVTLGIIPFSADRSLLHPVEMFFMHDDAQVNVELVSGWLRVTAWAFPVPARNTSPQHFVVNDRPSSLHIVADEPFLRLEAVRHDDVYPARQVKRHDRRPTQHPGCG